MRGAAGMVVALALLTGGAAEACRFDQLPTLERLAEADAVVRARLVSRRAGPALTGGDGRGGDESEILTLRVLHTYKGDVRAEWEVIWRLGFGVTSHTSLGKRLYTDNPHFNLRDGGDYIAGIVISPHPYVAVIDGGSQGGAGMDGTTPAGRLPFLMFDFCSAGAAYLFPFDRATEARVTAIMGLPQ
ncbi:hypothetical protein H0I76_10710 [Limibaculum sp. M0105]|uniref:Uncharacterized protein n=1 Tax=Thermohalobaculum xanthum TaxID=2753746 RepID=A0A8J7M6Y1_9RHOB|nr:hypothetical protein [Thermohalobaculum xanthum]MBK0399664.1 hypothetical protein [Thermohalobaculum xanthum]